MITAELFIDVLDRLGEQGLQDVAWAESLGPPVSAEEMALDIVFVICNSGMKHTVARLIYDRCRAILVDGGMVQGKVLGRSGKAKAIDVIWRDREKIFAEYTSLPNDERRVAYLRNLPWIGDITKYHAAKNFGLIFAKPDVHLQRLADLEGCTPQALCERVSRETVYSVATVDTILWRACATGVLDSRTGRLR